MTCKGGELATNDWDGASIVAGSLRGYKLLRFAESLFPSYSSPDPYQMELQSPIVMTSVNRPPGLTTWDDQWKTALCIGRQVPGLFPGLFPPPLQHLIPNPYCSCGIYACHTLSDLHQYAISTFLIDSSLITACVEATGRVLVSEKGFRAEKARIVGLAPGFFTGSYYQFIHGVSRLDWIPNVKLLHQTSQLEEEFPPAPVDELLKESA